MNILKTSDTKLRDPFGVVESPKIDGSDSDGSNEAGRICLGETGVGWMRNGEDIIIFSRTFCDGRQSAYPVHIRTRAKEITHDTKMVN